jgi:hypothetical protein
MGKTNKQIKDYRHEHVDIYKITLGCSICGYDKHPSCLCFDHLPNQEKSEHVKNGYSKRSSAGGMYRLYSKKHSIKDLVDEINKCRLLCHNCHMEITHSRNTRSKDKTEKRIIDLEELEKRLKEFESN